jgi:hypothetical protein
MKTSILVLVLAVMAACHTKPATISLFNGQDLTGWHADIPERDTVAGLPESFAVRNGVLVSLGKPEGHLITDSVFSNYRLSMDYRFTQGAGNCGVLVHVSRPRMLYKMFPQSIEAQLHTDDAGDFWCIGEDISVPDMEKRRGPKEEWGATEGKKRRILNLNDGAEKPLGEWNHYDIECRNNSITVWVNQVLVNAGTGCTTDHGQIALQAEGAEVEFKNIVLTSLQR